MLRCVLSFSRQANLLHSSNRTGKLVIGSVPLRWKSEVSGMNASGLHDSSKLDLSVLVVQLFSDVIVEERAVKHQQRKDKFDSGGTDRQPVPPPSGVSILDCSVSGGATALRYLRELPRLRHITINEQVHSGTSSAVQSALSAAQGINMHKVTSLCRDPRGLLYEHIEYQKNFDIIDLSQEVAGNYTLIDAAVQAISSDGGLICFTSRDHSALLGQNMEACFSRYGTVTLNSSPYRNELALRTLICAIEASAARYKRYVVPWLSVWSENTATVYVRVYEDGEQAKHALNRRIMLYQSSLCATFYTQPMGLAKSGRQGDKTIERTETSAVASSSEVSLLLSPQDNNPADKLSRKSTTAATTTVPVRTIRIPTPPANAEYRPAQWQLPGQCEESGGAWKIAGPFWGGALHDHEVLTRLIGRIRSQRVSSHLAGKQVTTAAPAVTGAAGTARSSGKTNEKTGTREGSDRSQNARLSSAPQLLQLLGNLNEELDVPFYYALSSLAAALQCAIPPYMDFTSALTNAGYKTSPFHGDVHVVKTDAPPSVVWDVMRGFCKTSAGRHSKFAKLGPVAQRILDRPCQLEANFVHNKEDRKKMFSRKSRSDAAKQ